jgi:epsilon-lactone hydrolase
MAATHESDFLRALYQSWSDRMAANPGYTIADLRSLFDEWHQPTLEPEGVTYKSEVIAGVDAIWALPVDADVSRVLVYTHGGGFAVGSAASHRKLAGHFARELGATAVLIDYRRAPEHPFPAQLEDSTGVYRELLARGFAASAITTIGDSAGANLAISTVLKLRDDGTELPGHVIALSPWLDMEHAGETLDTNAATDALVSRAILQGMSGMFLDDPSSASHPLANPLYADYAGFPRLYVAAGSIETLLDNATRLAGTAQAAGIDVTLSVVEGQQHVFPCLAGRAKEADEEIARIASWYRS